MKSTQGKIIGVLILIVALFGSTGCHSKKKYIYVPTTTATTVASTTDPIPLPPPPPLPASITNIINQAGSTTINIIVTAPDKDPFADGIPVVTTSGSNTNIVIQTGGSSTSVITQTGSTTTTITTTSTATATTDTDDTGASPATSTATASGTSTNTTIQIGDDNTDIVSQPGQDTTVATEAISVSPDQASQTVVIIINIFNQRIGRAPDAHRLEHQRRSTEFRSAFHRFQRDRDAAAWAAAVEDARKYLAEH